MTIKNALAEAQESKAALIEARPNFNDYGEAHRDEFHVDCADYDAAIRALHAYVTALNAIRLQGITSKRTFTSYA